MSVATTSAERKGTIGLAPFSLKDAPSFIEAEFPVGRLSAEAYKERKAGAGQTLTALGSYWKGRKPLILVRAVVLGSLLPTTNNTAADLDIFLKLMAMDDAAFLVRLPLRDHEVAQMAIDSGSLTHDDLPTYFRIRDKFLEALGRDTPVQQDWIDALAARALVFDTDEESKRMLRLLALGTLTYEEKVRRAYRPEECDEAKLLADIWPAVNRHIGTDAHSLPELIDQLGYARFGHRPKVADTFCGGGSIPFEAARLGCDVYASDLNPIACMLTWGAFHIIGASRERRAEIEVEQRNATAAIDAEITRLGIEHDQNGNRAKAYLYCLETRCPKTGWMVPMLGSFIISKTRGVVATLMPDHSNRRYDIEIHTGASTEEMKEAANGTMRGGRLVHPMNPERSGVDIKIIRGDFRDAEGVNRNRLRLWEKSDFKPRADDIWQERLYCIQWITKESLHKPRQKTFYASVTPEDLEREQKVEAIVRENLSGWQNEGLVPDMPIEPGDKTDEPIRTRGWTHWHHLFAPRQLLLLSLVFRGLSAARLINVTNELNFHSKLCAINSRSANSGRDMCLDRVFINQALNTLLNYGVRSFAYAADNSESVPSLPLPEVSYIVTPRSASEHNDDCDVFITDPPYADAISYHEITEYFISWVRRTRPGGSPAPDFRFVVDDMWTFLWPLPSWIARRKQPRVRHLGGGRTRRNTGAIITC